MALTVTVGGADSQSYADADYAQTYFAPRLGGDLWPAENTSRCEQALLTAMRIVESLPFWGTKADSEQALLWPLINGYGDTFVDILGREFPSTAIPTEIKNAQCEIAYAMLLDDALNSPITIQQVLKTDRMMIDRTKPASVRLRFAMDWLRPFLAPSNGIIR